MMNSINNLQISGNVPILYCYSYKYLQTNKLNMKLRTYIVIFIILFLLTNISAQTGKISYQGRLTDIGGIPFSGDKSIQFTIYYFDEVGTDMTWSETHTVTVTDGLFNVLLGSTTPLPPP